MPAFKLRDATCLGVAFFLMSQLKMKMKHGGFVCAALDWCNGSFNRQSLDMRLLFYLGFVFHFFFKFKIFNMKLYYFTRNFLIDFRVKANVVHV